MKKCKLCGAEITVEIEGSNWDVPLPSKFGRGGMPFEQSILKKRYNKTYCLQCNQNQGRFYREKNTPQADEKSEYLGLKYDFEREGLSLVNAKRFKELRKKFEMG